MNKNLLITTTGVIGGFVTQLFGGWDMALQTLIIFMAMDYITGLALAAIFQKSPKTNTGALESRAGFKGLCQKGLVLLIVLIAVRLDLLFDSDFLRNTVIIAFICNEAISILENAGLMGIPIPSKLLEAIELLKKKEDSSFREKEENEKNKKS